VTTLQIGAIPHSYDGSSYYRIWLPFTHLEERSHHITQILPPGSRMPGPRDLQDVDVVVIQRPAGKAGARFLQTLVGHGTKIVYEIDDDMLNVESAGLPHLYDDQARESIRRCLRLSDMVTASSPHLAEMVRPYNDNIVVLPNHIKAGLLDITRPRRDRLTIGWAGGTSHAWDVEEIRDPLRDITADYPDVDIHWIGANHSPILGRSCRWTKWEQDVGHYYKHIDFDIAVAPSADNLFNRSKTWLRALEMGALGIPVVASNRLPYSDYVIDGKTGFLVNNREEWTERLRDLVNDADMREEMGAAGKEQAAQWTIEEGWRLWEQAYESAVS
jgi:glycosyltransferase involved in cell wall biosynthesis